MDIPDSFDEFIDGIPDDLPDDVRPGRYRGTLLADGHEDVWLPVLLVVGASSA